MRAGILLREGAHGIPHGAAVGMGEGHEGRAHTADGRAEAAQPAALDQDREAAGELRLGEALHQLGEGPRRPGAEGHVECAAEAAADADEAAAAHRIAHQELGRQRRREGAGLGRFGGPSRRVGSRGHGAPVGCGGVCPVEQHPHGPERRLVVEAFGHDAGLPEQCTEGVHERPVPWLEPVEHGQGALGLAGLRQPGPETRAQAFAGASGLGSRQDRGPRPAGEDRGLGSEQGREPTRTLVEDVAQSETEPCCLAPGPCADALHHRACPVGIAFEHQVEGMAGGGEPAVETPAGKLHEAFQLRRARHGSCTVQTEERDQ